MIGEEVEDIAMKAVIFDARGVFLKGDFSDFVKNSCRRLNITSDKFSEKMKGRQLNRNLHLGKISLRRALTEYFGVKISDDEMKDLLKIWLDNWNINPRMRELALKLKAKHKLALVSNSEKHHVELFTHKGWYDCFDVVLNSHEIGIVKPNPRIYQLVCDKLSVESEECIFIDDTKAFVDGAKSTGMNAILFKSAEQLKRELLYFSINAG